MLLMIVLNVVLLSLALLMTFAFCLEKREAEYQRELATQYLERLADMKEAIEHAVDERG